MNVIKIFSLIGLVSVQAFASGEIAQEVDCKLEIINYNKSPRTYTLFGSIKEKTGLDYLTLEPNSSSGAQFSARILLTGDYDPVTLHPRGNTVNTVARGDLAKTDEVHLTYFDEANDTNYVLDCKNL